MAFVLKEVFAVLDIKTFVHLSEYDFIGNSVKLDRTAKPSELIEIFLKRKRHIERYIRKHNFQFVQFVTDVPNPGNVCSVTY